MNHDVPPGLEDRLQHVLLDDFFPNLAVEELFIVDHMLGDSEAAGFTTFYVCPGEANAEGVKLDSEPLNKLVEFMGGTGFEIGHSLDNADNELVVTVYGVMDWSAVERRVGEMESARIERKKTA